MKQIRNRIILSIAMILGAGLTAAPAAAQQSKPDASGVWGWNFENPGGGDTLVTTMTLHQEGEKLTGTTISSFDGVESPIAGGTVKDGEVSFSVTRDFNGQEFTIHYGGKIEGETWNGWIEFGGGDQAQSFEFAAKRLRKPLDPTGAWLRIAPIDARSSSFTLEISRADGQWVGIYRRGGAGSAPGRVGQLTIEGGTISFSYQREGRGPVPQYRYSGKIGGDTIQGTEQTSFQGRSVDNLPWNMKRDKAADATGSWRWTIDTGGGQTIDRTAALKQEGEKLTGTSTANGTSTPISDGIVKGKEVSFTINIDFGGGAITTKYKGTLDGDGIKGTIQTDFGGEATTLDWNATRIAQ